MAQWTMGLALIATLIFGGAASATGDRIALAAFSSASMTVGVMSPTKKPAARFSVGMETCRLGM